MAEVFRSINGVKLEKAIALHKDVQDELANTVFRAKARADVLMKEHRVDGQVQFRTERHDIDHYLFMVDGTDKPTKNSESAVLAVNYGRKAGEKTVVDPITGEVKVYRWGAMDGLYILERAFGLPKRGGKKVKLEPDTPTPS